MKTLAHIIFLSAGIVWGALARPRYRKHRAWTAPAPFKEAQGDPAAECIALATDYATKLGVPRLSGAVDAPAYLKDPK